MIPIHDLSQTQSKEIVIAKLGHLSSYDFGEPHRHEYYELFCFEEGEGIHTIDFVEYKIESNSIHVVAPGQVHQVKRELSSNGMVVLFEADALEASQSINNFLFNFICFDSNEVSPIYNNVNAATLKNNLERIWKAKNDKSATSSLEIQNSIQQLLIECMKLGASKMPMADSIYISFRKLLRSRYKENHKVQDYSKILNVSDKQLNEAVKKQTGKTVSQLIYKQLILEAKRLLLTNSSVKETSFILNFEDPAHFSKFFKSQTGLTPKEFRNVHV